MPTQPRHPSHSSSLLQTQNKWKVSGFYSISLQFYSDNYISMIVQIPYRCRHSYIIPLDLLLTDDAHETRVEGHLELVKNLNLASRGSQVFPRIIASVTKGGFVLSQSVVAMCDRDR